MVVEIYAGLTAFKTIMDSAKALAEMHDESTRLRASIELLRQINAAQQDYQAALQRIATLEAEIAQIKTRSGDLERYELKGIGRGSSAYMLKPDARGAEPPHWLCPTCYANGKKSMYQFSSRFGGGRVYRCAGCKGHAVAEGEPTWS